MLYSPGDIWVTSIREQLNVTENYTDYALNFSSCSDLLHVLGHVRNLSPKLAAAFTAPFDSHAEGSTGGNYFSTNFKNVEIYIQAGEALGTVLRRGALDFTTIDRRVPAVVSANPARWSSDRLHTFCSVDYFTTETKSSLKNLFGYTRTLKRTTEPLCGTFAQDVPNTAQGNWFVKNTASFSEDPHLALVHDNLNSIYGIFSVGTALSSVTGLATEIYNFTPLHSGEYNREFSEVASDGKVYCYDAIFGYDAIWGNLNSTAPKYPILIQLTSSTTLRVAKLSASSCGAGPWTIGNSFVEYER